MVMKTNVLHMMQEVKEKIRQAIVAWLVEAGVDAPQVVFERAAQPEFGEYASNAAMRYAKQLGKNPLELAETLAVHLESLSIPGLMTAEAVRPGFLNLHFSPEVKIGQVGTILERRSAFGSNESHLGEKWVIEHTSPNPNKAMHIGHLRLNLVGMGIVQLMKAAGAEVIADAVYNDRGISIAKAMYGFLAHMKQNDAVPTDIQFWISHKEAWLTPEAKGMKPDEFITECYVLGEADTKASLEIDAAVRQMVVAWEAEDAAVWELWRHVLQFAYDGNERVLARLGSHWDKVWYEHEHYQAGKAYIERGLESGLFTKLEDGAILTNLEEQYKLPDTILLKNDGTSLYITQDIALTDLKKRTYGADRLVWVIGPDQSLALKQLFAVCEQLGIGSLDEFTHVSYGYVGLKNEDGSFKKMSSRAGTVVLLDDVIDTVKATICERFKAEEKHDVATREALSETLALAAVKFAFLKPDRMQDISFDLQQSVDVQGDSGMYVEYTYVRTQSILKKAGMVSVETIPAVAELGVEAELLRTMLYFEDVVQKSIDDLSVHHVAQYLLELCAAFNSWYGKEVILDGTEREAYRLAIVTAIGQLIENGGALLGIEMVDEM